MSVILLGQCLHAFSFAAYHSAIMRFIRDQAPQDIQVFTQGIDCTPEDAKFNS